MRLPKYKFLLVVLLLFQCACPLIKKNPPLDVIFAKAGEKRGKLPVIIIPGVLGTELVNSKTNEKVWFSRSSSKDDTLALPTTPNLSENRDSLIPITIIQRTKVYRLLPEVEIYEALIKAMQKYGGYKEGSWENPTIESAYDTYYIFKYDWRRDNVENARLLIRKVEDLKRKLGKSDLKFNVLAHSMGGLIIRYAVMYGDKDLPVSEPKPDWAGAKHFNKIFTFGTPNKGSMAAFIGLLEGYSTKTITGTIRFSNLSPDVLFTFPSAFQLLPSPENAKFYDENLRPLEIDLYDPIVWKTFGWGALYSKAKRKGEKVEFSEGTPEYFERVLNRARLFHEALDAETKPPTGLTFFVFGSDCTKTIDGVILRRDPKKGSWITLYKPTSYRTSDGRKIKESEVERLIFSPGDGRVTRESLISTNILTTVTSQRFSPNVVNFFCEEHGDLVNNKIVQNNFLTSLILESQ